MVDQNIIQDKYYHILELLDKSPGNEEALNTLIDLEQAIKGYLFDVLENKHGEKLEQSNVYSSIKDGKRVSDRLETLVMNKTTGDKISINQLADMFIKKIDDILNSKVSNEEKIKLLKIQYIKLKETILPPDYETKPITGSGAGWIEKQNKIDKFSFLISILREKGIYSDDILAIEGVNLSNMMRKQSYVCLQIPRINKTILINNQYGEATFVYDGILDIQYFTELGKKGLSPVLNKIIFQEDNIDGRKNQIINSLFGENIGPKIDIKDLKNQTVKAYKRAEIISFYETLSPEEQKEIVVGADKYKKLAKKYPQLPKRYRGLIPILGGDNRCLRGGYVEALLKGLEEGARYFEEREKTQKEKIERTRAEFINFYENLSPEEQKEVVGGQDTYLKTAKKYPQLPKSYQGLITILGGDKRCQQGGYVEALLKSPEEGAKYFTEQESRKNKIKASIF